MSDKVEKEDLRANIIDFLSRVVQFVCALRAKAGLVVLPPNKEADKKVDEIPIGLVVL